MHDNIKNIKLWLWFSLGIYCLFASTVMYAESSNKRRDFYGGLSLGYLIADSKRGNTSNLFYPSIRAGYNFNSEYAIDVGLAYFSIHSNPETEDSLRSKVFSLMPAITYKFLAEDNGNSYFDYFVRGGFNASYIEYESNELKRKMYSVAPLIGIGISGVLFYDGWLWQLFADSRMIATMEQGAYLDHHLQATILYEFQTETRRSKRMYLFNKLSTVE